MDRYMFIVKHTPGRSPLADYPWQITPGRSPWQITPVSEQKTSSPAFPDVEHSLMVFPNSTSLHLWKASNPNSNQKSTNVR